MLPRDVRLPPSLFPDLPPSSSPSPSTSLATSSSSSSSSSFDSSNLQPKVSLPGLATPAVHVYGAEDYMLPHSKALATWWSHGRTQQQQQQQPQQQQGVVIDPVAQALSPPVPHSVEVLHSGGHKFPSGPGAAAHYATISAVVKAHCQAQNPTDKMDAAAGIHYPPPPPPLVSVKPSSL